MHAETDAFRKASQQRSGRDTVMVTTLAPCWYCSGLVRQFRIGTVGGGVRQLPRRGCLAAGERGEVVDLRSEECVRLLGSGLPRIPACGTRILGRNEVALPGSGDHRWAGWSLSVPLGLWRNLDIFLLPKSGG